MVNSASTDGENQPEDSPQPVVAAIVTKTTSGPTLASKQPRHAANPNSLSLSSLFTLTTLAALVVMVFCYHPYLLCLLVPLSLPTTARMVYLRDLRIVSGENPTLTNMSLDWGASLLVSAIAITSAVTTMLQIAAALAPIETPPLAIFAVLTILFSLLGMIAVGYYGISKIWEVFCLNGRLPSWPQRIGRFMHGILQIVWMQALPFFAINYILPSWNSSRVNNVTDAGSAYLVTISIIFATGAIGLGFANRLPIAAFVTAIALLIDTIFGSPSWIAVVGLLLGLGIEWQIGMRKTPRI